CSPAWRTGRPSRLSSLWWASAGLGAALAVASFLTESSSAWAPRLAGSAALVLAVSAIALHGLVHRIGRRQRRRAELLGVAPTSPRPAPPAAPAPAARASVELDDSSVPTRLEPLRAAPPGRPTDGRRTTALRQQPATRRPVWGKY